MCFGEKAELSIRLRFREKGKGYYGYIWRIITSHGLNIDLVFKPSPNRHKFNLVIGKHASGMSFEVDRRYDWNEIKLRSEEHTSELQSLMRISYAVFCLKKKIIQYTNISPIHISSPIPT